MEEGRKTRDPQPPAEKEQGACAATAEARKVPHVPRFRTCAQCFMRTCPECPALRHLCGDAGWSGVGLGSTSEPASPRDLHIRGLHPHFEKHQNQPEVQRCVSHSPVGDTVSRKSPLNSKCRRQNHSLFFSLAPVGSHLPTQGSVGVPHSTESRAQGCATHQPLFQTSSLPPCPEYELLLEARTT